MLEIFAVEISATPILVSWKVHDNKIGVAEAKFWFDFDVFIGIITRRKHILLQVQILCSSAIQFW